MRRFTDESGQRWDVTPGRASWGALYGIFVPVSDTTPDDRSILQADLQAPTMDEAARRLDQMPLNELRELLAQARPAQDADS